MSGVRAVLPHGRQAVGGAGDSQCGEGLQRLAAVGGERVGHGVGQGGRATSARGGILAQAS